MNRKLHNTFFAMTASGALLALGLIVGAPALQPAPAEAQLAAIEADLQLAMAGSDLQLVLAEAAVGIEQAEQAAESARDAAAAVSAPNRRSPSHRRSRQSVAMPYFSFAPRG